MREESGLMSFFRKIGMDKIAWSLRRVYCPVKPTDLVLEIGSGGNPFFRANVLCDAFDNNTAHRQFEGLIHDRPTVLAFAEDLPFKDNSFDFAIACHVLEHSEDPDKFLSEMQRVARAGYIEVPDAFVERLTTYPVHRLEITDRNHELIIRKKKAIIEDPEVSELFRHKADQVFNGFFSQKPFHFHVRYYWSKDTGGIKYHIVNPEYKFDWELINSSGAAAKLNIKQKIKKNILKCLRKFFSQTKRNKNIDLRALLKDQKEYEINNGIINIIN
jgi:SAM-dependent methyltransferase